MKTRKEHKSEFLLKVPQYSWFHPFKWLFECFKNKVKVLNLKLFYTFTRNQGRNMNRDLSILNFESSGISSQNIIQTGSKQERCKKHPPIARNQFSLLYSVPLHKTRRSYSASLMCKSVATKMLGSGYVYCPKVNINQLEFKCPFLWSVSQLPV